MLLKNTVSITQPRTHVILVTSHFMTAEIEHEEITATFTELLATTRSPERALCLAQCSSPFHREFLAFLHDHRLIFEFPVNSNTVPASVAAEIISRDLDYWADRLYCERFWDVMADPGKASNANAIYAWSIENYHHTHHVMRHLGMALGHTDDRAAIDTCMAHLKEEWDHPYLFRQSAERFRKIQGLAPLSGTLVPLGSTQSICNLLRLGARRHLFTYKTCVAVLEKTARRVAATREYFKQIADGHHLDYAVLAPLVQHAETDEEYGHLNSLCEFSKQLPSVSLATLNDSINLAFRFTDALHLWQRHLLDYYLAHNLGEGHRTY